MNQLSPEHQLINRLNNSCVKFNLQIYIIIISFQIYTLNKMQHLALVLYKEYPKTCTLLCSKSYCACSFECSIRVYWYLMWSIYSSISTTPLIRICKILELESHLLNCTVAVTLLWYDHNFLMINNLCWIFKSHSEKLNCHICSKLFLQLNISM